MHSEYYPYDIETYLNCFTIVFKRHSDKAQWRFEISPWKNEGFELYIFIQQIANSNGVMVGFNNWFFDYPVLHKLMERQGQVNAAFLYRYGQQIINDGKGGPLAKWQHAVWDRDQYCPQIDLFRIHHFDNKAKMTSLKLLEFNMRMNDIQELPYSPHEDLNQLQLVKVFDYNEHDVDATDKFLGFSMDMLDMRYQLSNKFGENMLNDNDVKIGEKIVVDTLKKSGVHLKKGMKTLRSEIRVNEIIFDYINFRTPEFNAALEWFRDLIIYPDEIKEEDDNKTKKKYTVDFEGFHFDLGLGGIHGSLSETVLRTTKEKKIKDIDVEGYYPSISISNGVYPAHIGPAWCEAMQWMKKERIKVGKKTAIGNGYKLGGNGSYGKSKDKHSVMYDPQYTMTITINGQLMLCMLAEELMLSIPDFEMVQVNTDGLTCMYPPKYEEQVSGICTWWEQLTRLVLEHVDYNLMAIRDVNNYLAVTKPYKDKEGKLVPSKVKRIGAYAYELALDNPGTRELPWHKNHSAVVVAKAAEAALVRNVNIETFIRGHIQSNPWDFYLRTKVNRSSQLFLESLEYWGDVTVNTRSDEIQRVSRYYISNRGGKLIKVMKPTEKKQQEWLDKPHWRHIKTGETKQGKKAPSGMWVQIDPPSKTRPDTRTGIDSKYCVTIANTIENGVPDLTDLNVNYYVNESRKLVDKLIA